MEGSSRARPRARAGLRETAARLLGSSKLQAGGGFLLGAVAFAVANLIFAHFLSPEAFASLVLTIAIAALGSPVAPLGLGVMVGSGRLVIDKRLLAACASTSALVASVATLIAWLMYGLVPAAVAAVAGMVLSGGFVRLAGARLQREQRFLGSTLVSESANYTLLAAAVLAWLAGWQAYEAPALLVCAAQILLVALGWSRFLAVTTPEVNARLPWVGMLLLAGTSAASLAMLQLERLAIPVFLELEALAQFAVLAIFAMAPFRPLEFSIYRTLLSHLGHASSVDERRRLVVQELRHAVVVLVGMAVMIVVATPAVFSYLFSGKYEITWPLVLPAVVGAQLRVLRSLVSAAVAALASHRELAIWNVGAWASVALMLLGGWVGSAYGLAGFLWGVNVGAALNIAFTTPIMLRRLT